MNRIKHEMSLIRREEALSFWLTKMIISTKTYNLRNKIVDRISFVNDIESAAIYAIYNDIVYKQYFND